MDRASLQWVRDDVDESLKQARVNLEAYAADHDEVHPMLECAETLHGVQGVLEMLEVYGASLLLDELEKLCRAVHVGEVVRRDDACQIIMQGIVQVPDYLDYIARGSRDNPIVLMPVLNDVRSIRGQTLLSENALFNPDLNAPLPVRERPVALHGEAFSAYAKKLRPHFQRGLVGWFRGGEVTAGLKLIESVVIHVQRLIGSSPSSRLWWVARAVLDALGAGGLEQSASVKQLVGQLDRQLRRYAREGESATGDFGPPELLKNLLYYCSQAKPGGRRLETIRKAFGLSELMVSPTLQDASSSLLLGPSLDTVASVSGALKETIGRIEDGLDRFNRMDTPSASDLEPLLGLLRQVGDTLGLLGLGVPRRAILDQQEMLTDHVEANALPGDVELMNVASALVGVERALDQVADEGVGGTLDRGASEPEEMRSGIEYLQLVTSVVGEAKADIVAIKDVVATFIADQAQRDRFPEVPDRVANVVGGMRMLNLETAADLTETWLRYVDRVLLSAETPPGEEALDGLANGIEALDYYLESIASASPDSELRLAQAGDYITALDVPEVAPSDADQGSARTEPAVEEASADLAPDAEIARDVAEDESPPTGEVEVDEPFEIIAVPVEEEELPPAAEATHAEEVDVDDDVVMQGMPDGEDLGEGGDALIAKASPDSVQVDELEASEGEITLTGMGEVTPVEPATEFPSAECGAEPPRDRGDDEAYFEFGVADASTEPDGGPPGSGERGEDDPAFDTQPTQDTHDGDGQGEPRGAIDGGEDPAPAPLPDAVARTLQDAREALERIDGEPPPDIIGGHIVDDSAAGDADAGVAAIGDDIDPEILEVFLEEGQEAYETLLEHLPVWEKDPTDSAALTEVRRAFHTLKGSGRMVGAMTIGDFCWSVENTLNRVIDGLLPANDVLMALLNDAVSALPSLFGELRGQGASGVDVAVLAARAEGLTDPRRAPQSPPPLAGGGSTAAALAVDSEPDPDVSAEILEFPLRREESAEPHEPTAAAPTVFEREAHGHLSEICSFADRDECSPHVYVRPAHTLKSAAHTAALPGLSGLFGAVEAMLTNLVSLGVMLDTPAIGFLREVTHCAARAISSSEAEHGVEIERLTARAPQVTQAACTAVGANTQDGAFDDVLAERQELREIFLEEAAEILDTYDAVLERWRAQGANRELLDELQRGLHTLKGGARMAQFGAIGDLSHALESITALAVESRLEPDQAMLDVVEATQDKLADMLDCVVAQQPLLPADELIVRIEALASGQSLPDVDAVDEAASREEIPSLVSDGLDADDTVLSERDERISVDAELLDNLSGFAGEISMSQSRIEQQVGGFRLNLDELDQTVSRLRDQLRRLEIETESQIVYRREREGVLPDATEEDFDPLEFDRFSRMQELSRGLAESVGDLTNIRDMLGGLTRESESILIQQARTNTDLQHGLTQTRMLPFSRLMPRLRRVVRQTARELGKRVRLEVTGEEIRVDRTILNRIIGAFEHLLRNSVDHGVENLVTRTEAGKPAEGVVRLDIARDGPEVVLEVSDDGAGIAVDAVRAKAQARGLVSPEMQLTDDEVLQFIFEPGFSTRDQVTQVSGRGVGLDVVQNDAKQLGGSVRAANDPDAGARFTLRVPLTLAINQALMVVVGHEELGLPLANVDAVIRMSSDEAERLESSEHPVFEHTGLRYPFAYLGAALGVAEPSYHQDRYPVILVRAGEHRVALRVDELRGRSEVVVKAVGPMLSAIRWISGATIMGDGRVILILDAPTLASVSASPVAVRQQPAPREIRGAATVMVVDDSITVRKVTGRFLQRNGMKVVTAKDGVEALGFLQEELPDVMLLDIEMPRMDGFELATTIRNDERMRDLPIIMITSRSGSKHSERAAQIGVDRYLGKPYHEGELVENINAVLGSGARRSG